MFNVRRGPEGRSIAAVNRCCCPPDADRVMVEIAEARAGAARAEGAFLGLAPNGMNVLDQLGIGQAVARHGFACDAFRFWNGASKAIGFIDRSKDQQRIAGR